MLDTFTEIEHGTIIFLVEDSCKPLLYMREFMISYRSVCTRDVAQ